MSKGIFLCRRDAPLVSSDQCLLAAICEALTPDNSKAAQHRTQLSGQIAWAVSGFMPSVCTADAALLLGELYEAEADWRVPGTPTPDGSFALFRANSKSVELLSDAVASRTIWYYHDEQQFVAATSQRAIVLLLGTFEFNAGVIPWMLSTGTPGPEFSWDRRIRRIGPDSRVTLDRSTWTLQVETRPIVFAPRAMTREQHQSSLRTAIGLTFAALSQEKLENWALPLSGGYDSRAILCLLKNNANLEQLPQTITWGLAESQHDKGNDAYVAKQLAAACSAPHTFFSTDVSAEPVDRIIDRFILASEGRIDHVAGYMDGLDIWRSLSEEHAIGGIIRGDEGFGWCEVSSELTVRFSVGCALCSDFANLATIIADFDLTAQELAPTLVRQAGESLDTWKDRLYHSFRIPTLLAALSDIKLAYVEQITPLLSRRILAVVRHMPDELRLDKALFKDIVNEISPPIPFATRGANAEKKDLLKRPDIALLIKNRLNAAQSRVLLGDRLIDHILSGIRTTQSNRKGPIARLKAIAKTLLPRSVKNRLWDSVAAPKVDGNVLAFRLFTILRMHEQLTLDAKRFG